MRRVPIPTAIVSPPGSDDGTQQNSGDSSTERGACTLRGHHRGSPLPRGRMKGALQAASRSWHLRRSMEPQGSGMPHRGARLDSSPRRRRGRHDRPQPRRPARGQSSDDRKVRVWRSRCAKYDDDARGTRRGRRNIHLYRRRLQAWITASEDAPQDSGMARLFERRRAPARTRSRSARLRFAPTGAGSRRPPTMAPRACGTRRTACSWRP